jgi:hypothetical protein
LPIFAAAAALLVGQRSIKDILPPRALPQRQIFSNAPVPIYEMGSKGGKDNRFSIRIGDHHRAIGRLTGDVVEWVWIGSHEDYNKLM